MWRPKASVGDLEAVVTQHPKDFRSRLLDLSVEVRACLPVRVRKAGLRASCHEITSRREKNQRIPR